MINLDEPIFFFCLLLHVHFAIVFLQITRHHGADHLLFLSLIHLYQLLEIVHEQVIDHLLPR